MTSVWLPIGLDNTGAFRNVFGGIVSIGAAGAVTTVTGGAGIGVSGGATPNPTITNTGVITVNPGAGINLSGTAQSVTVTNSGVISVNAGTGISLAGGSQNPTIANTGVLSVTAGTGITVGGTSANPSVANSGVLTVTAGTGISVGGTSANPSVANTGVLALTAGTGVTLSGSVANYTINATPLTNAATVDTFGPTNIQLQSSANTGAPSPYTVNLSGVRTINATTHWAQITVTLSGWATANALPAGAYYLINAVPNLPVTFWPISTQNFAFYMGNGTTIRQMMIFFNPDGSIVIMREDSSAAFPITNYAQITSGEATLPLSYPSSPGNFVSYSFTWTNLA